MNTFLICSNCGFIDFLKEKVFAVFGTMNVIDDYLDWWFMTCVCNQKVYLDERMYFCSKCNMHVLNVTPRYLLICCFLLVVSDILV